MAKRLKRSLKKSVSMREKAAQAGLASNKPRRVRKTAGKIGGSIKRFYDFMRKEHYIPFPDTRFWRFMNKRRHLIPSYFRNSWQELRQVTWPSRKETWKLTLAVFIFATVFGILIAITDYGLDKLFRKVLIKG